MNIGFFKKPKAHSVFATLFFAGIVISACALYLLPSHLSEDAMRQTYWIVGITFFMGIVSINLMARSKKQTVVYLERKTGNTATEGEGGNTDSQSQIDIDGIKRIIESRHEVPQRLINELCHQLQAGQGAFYVAKDGTLELKYGYALSHDRASRITYAFGEGLAGRVAAEGRMLYIDKLPKGYITIFSGLGSASPTHLVLVPVKMEGEIKGVMEIATFAALNEQTRRHLENTGESLGDVIL
jgi:transcriptional regulator with GAF, ATPase, and Fis domain